eukprot:CAMPEP_0113708114 /NCGR_PEP_ID=MMETSP0038_2-20120614/28789_1 /TAXON_ID=2898 /ORGANISM="Cryptomonas paramecium" /LENGTH=349 /DNA_ID=CAMNT_0000633759 /DNA_START=46 /DNA_END=1092 /DNA_ORIENTATION=- /assembly_acc=CAM_ASM_000170
MGVTTAFVAAIVLVGPLFILLVVALSVWRCRVKSAREKRKKFEPEPEETKPPPPPPETRQLPPLISEPPDAKDFRKAEQDPSLKALAHGQLAFQRRDESSEDESDREIKAPAAGRMSALNPVPAAPTLPNRLDRSDEEDDGGREDSPSFKPTIGRYPVDLDADASKNNGRSKSIKSSQIRPMRRQNSGGDGDSDRRTSPPPVPPPNTEAPPPPLPPPVLAPAHSFPAARKDASQQPQSPTAPRGRMVVRHRGTKKQDRPPPDQQMTTALASFNSKPRAADEGRPETQALDGPDPIIESVVSRLQKVPASLSQQATEKRREACCEVKELSVHERNRAALASAGAIEALAA